MVHSLADLWSWFLLITCLSSIPGVSAQEWEIWTSLTSTTTSNTAPVPVLSSTTASSPINTTTSTTARTSVSSSASCQTATTSPLAAVPGQPSPISYSGTKIFGTAQLPQSLSTAIFPHSAQSTGIPQHSGSLGLNALSQQQANGGSLLGTFQAPKYPLYNGAPSGSTNSTAAPAAGLPWGGRTANGTNPYTQAPVTGVTRSYSFVISRGYLAPDGFETEMLLINGQYPGPTIEANWGDTIEVTVTNNIFGPQEGTALHWHGLLQQATPFEDGIPGITQCPIAPGQTFTYTFNADLYGTSWYHSHYSAQYAGGVVGAMIIHGPQNAQYDEDLGPVLLSDFFHTDYNTLVEDVMGTDLSKLAPFSDNNLINGKGNYDCSLVQNGSSCTPNAGLSKFTFTSGKTYRLRLVNTGAEAIQQFSIDNHTMTVIAYDFVPINPYTTNVVTLGVGQRADVLVKATGAPSSVVWMRSTIPTSCSLTLQPNGLAIIYYSGANSTATEPTSQAWPVDGTSCANDALSLTVPYAPITPPQSQTTVNIDLNFEINATGNFLFTMDNSTFRTDYNNPVLPMAIAGNDSFPEEWNVYNFGSNSSFTIVVQNQTPLVHPMHIHGHNMFVLNEGSGQWDGSVVNPSNPMRRDVVLLRPGGYMAFQLSADNPGVWPFHCHIAWHVSGGLYVNILSRTDLIPQIQYPSSVTDLCTAWSAFTAEGPIDQIDSGLKKRERRHNHMNRHKFSNVVRRSM